jgi:hypothetical protein
MRRRLVAAKGERIVRGRGHPRTQGGRQPDDNATKQIASVISLPSDPTPLGRLGAPYSYLSLATIAVFDRGSAVVFRSSFNPLFTYLP